MGLRLVVMGVSGCGKSRLGAAIGDRLGLPFHDADDLHPQANRDKMAAGTGLDDADRAPWLDRVAEILAAGDCIMACSALKRAYRDRLRQGARAPLVFLHLTAPAEVISSRLARRQGHFMPPALLASQLATLEPPLPREGVLTVDVGRDFETVLTDSLRKLADFRRPPRLNTPK